MPDNEVKTQDPAETYNPSTRLPAKRELKVERPGNVNYAAPGGSFPGSRVVVFGHGGATGLEPEDDIELRKQAEADGLDIDMMRPVEVLNLYFKHRANLLTVAVQPTFDGDIVVIFTNHLEGERLEWFRKYQDEIARVMERWESEQAEKAKRDEEKAEAARKENEALLALGKKARDHNLIERLRELDEEVKRLRKEVAKHEKGGK